MRGDRYQGEEGDKEEDEQGHHATIARDFRRGIVTNLLFLTQGIWSNPLGVATKSPLSSGLKFDRMSGGIEMRQPVSLVSHSVAVLHSQIIGSRDLVAARKPEGTNHSRLLPSASRAPSVLATVKQRQ